VKPLPPTTAVGVNKQDARKNGLAIKVNSTQTNNEMLYTSGFKGGRAGNPTLGDGRTAVTVH